MWKKFKNWFKWLFLNEKKKKTMLEIACEMLVQYEHTLLFVTCYKYIREKNYDDFNQYEIFMKLSYYEKEYGEFFVKSICFKIMDFILREDGLEK